MSNHRPSVPGPRARRLQIHKSMSPAAMVVAVVALLFATAGVGYTAATVGTSDIQNNAITSPKVQDGALRDADLVREQTWRYVGEAGAPAFRNGGQGDCAWRSGDGLIPGVGHPGFRIDRFGTVHLHGIAFAENGTGGDAMCNPIDDLDDGVMFILPERYRPATHQARLIGPDGGVLVASNQAIDSGALHVPPGGVYAAGDAATSGTVLDGVSFLSHTSPVNAGTVSTSPQRASDSGRLLRILGIK